MAEIFEVIMIVSFGASWPLNVMKSYRARTTKGKSLAFLLLIFFGYIAGIISKLINDAYMASIAQTLHLNLETVTVVLDGLGSHHGTHIGTAGGVADHAGTAADEGDGLVAGHLQALHQAQSHEVTHVEGVGGGVKANVEGGLAVVDHFTNLFFVTPCRPYRNFSPLFRLRKARRVPRGICPSASSVQTSRFSFLLP